MKKAVWLIEAGLALILSAPFAILPLRWALRAGDILGLLLFYLWSGRRRIASENVANSVAVHALTIPSTVEATIRRNFRNIGKSLAEISQIYYGSGRRILDTVRIEGREHFESALAKGKGIIFITGHCGNWELLAIAASVKLSRLSIVVRPVNNLYINRLVERARKKYGNSVIYKKGALRPVVRGLKNNDCIGILMHQAVIPEEGFVIEFLGRKAWTTKMPALIARKTGASVIPAFIHREKDGHTISLYPEIALSGDTDKEKALKEDTERFSRHIEEYIREHPAEWLWMHRRWKRTGH